MTPSRAALRIPRSIEHALEMLSEATARPVVMAGGTHVMAFLSHDTPRITSFVDVSTLERLASVRIVPGGVAIGPCVTYSTLVVGTQPPVPNLLRKIAEGITGGPQIRNQGTVGGSACYANPSSDMPTGLIALDAEMHISSSKRGLRRVRAIDFFKGAFQTALEPDEMLVDIVVRNDSAEDRWGYVKLKTTESSWPVVVAAARLTGSIGPSTVTVTVGAATGTPFKLEPFALASGSELGRADGEVIRRAVRGAPVNWWSDELTDGEYRHRVAGVIAVRATEDAMKKDDRRI